MTFKKNKNNEINLDEKMSTIASSSKMLLFFQFRCPHCETINVFSKENRKEVVLCSKSGCRKMIIIKNFKDVA